MIGRRLALWKRPTIVLSFTSVASMYVQGTVCRPSFFSSSPLRVVRRRIGTINVARLWRRRRAALRGKRCAARLEYDAVRVLGVEFHLRERRERLVDEREELLGQVRILSRAAAKRRAPTLDVAIEFAGG